MSTERRGSAGGVALLVAVLSMLLFTASAQAATGRAYVARGGANALTPVDLGTGTLAAPITVDANPGEVAVSKDGTRAYVIAYNTDHALDNELAIVDTASATVIASVPIGHYPAGIAVSPDGTRVYVANFGQSITVIDATTNAVAADDVPGSGDQGFIQDVAISPDGTRLYWTENNSNHYGPMKGYLAAYTIATGNVNRIEVYDPGSVTLAPDGTSAYVSNVKTGGYTALDLTGIDAPLPVAGESGWPQIAVSADGSRLYLADHDDDSVTVRNAQSATHAVVQTIDVADPGAIAMAPDGSRVLVLSGADDDTLTQIDTATNTVLPGAIDVGAGATGLAAAVAPTPPEPAVCPAGQTGTPPNCQTPPPGSGGPAPPSPGGPAQELPSAVTDIAASAVPQPRIVRRTVRLRSGCVTSRLAVSGRGVKVTFAKRLPAGRCRITLRVSPTATGRRRDLLVKRDGRTVRLRGVVWL